MRIPKIYLETTMFNYYFQPEREAYPYVIKLFEEIKDGKYEAYTSAYVVDELLDMNQKKSQMMNLVEEYGFHVLDPSDEAVILAEFYVDEGVIPKRFLTDAMHIAAATVNDMYMILSLNFKHIVRKKTVERTEAINIREGYERIRIYAPQEVADYEEES